MSSRYERRGNMIIVVDPGHGGSDQGGRSLGRPESLLTLDYANELTSQLRAHGYTVYQTRMDDVAMGRSERAFFANDRKADLFISLHCNASNNKSARGCSVFYALGSKRGERIAQTIQVRLHSVMGGNPGAAYDDMSVHTRGPLTVLRRTVMPAVLVELGFMTNPVEIKRLESPLVRKDACRRIVRAVSVEYKIPEVTKPEVLPEGDLNLEFIKVPTVHHIRAIADRDGFTAQDINPGLRVILVMLKGLHLAGMKWAKPLADLIDEWLSL